MPELFQFYLLEAFLDRLSRSRYVEQLVLKGGVLLAALGERRATRDIDLQGFALANDADEIRASVCAITDIVVDDGVEFDTASAISEIIRDEDAYTGVRVSMDATLLPAKLRFQVDVSVGDPVIPEPELVRLPRLLGGELVVRGYPLTMVHAEKVATAIARGTANTRWRDFVDIYLLSGHHALDFEELRRSLERVAAHRSVTLRPLAEVLAGYGDIAQTKWATWRRKQQLDDRVPESFGDLIAAVAEFADPVITALAPGTRWDPQRRAWR